MTPAPELPAIELVIAPEEAGERLDKVLSARPIGLSRSTLQAWIEAGRVEVDGRVLRASAKVSALAPPSARNVARVGFRPHASTSQMAAA